MIELHAYELKRLAEQAAAVATDKAHPIFAFVTVEGPTDGLNHAVFQAASATGHARWRMGTGDLERLAVRREHLSTLAGLCPTGTSLTLDREGSGLRVRLWDTGDHLERTEMGSWLLPIAGPAELAVFPDTPPEDPLDAHGERYAWPWLAKALRRVDWVLTDDTAAQLSPAYLLTATYSAAVRSVIDAAGTGATAIVPGAGIRILRTVLEQNRDAGLRWVESEDRHHVSLPGVDLWLAKWSQAVEDIETAFFAGAPVEAVLVTNAAELSLTVRRAGALGGYVRLRAKGNEVLEVEAADGSSHQVLPVSDKPGGSGRALFSADTLRMALAGWEGSVLIEFRESVVVLSGARHQVALVPLRDEA